MRNLSTIVEILSRGKIIEIIPSTIRENTYICTFFDGTQANINEETFNKLNYKL